MSNITDALAGATAAIAALGALGTASYGLVDATKAFGGGVSNFGLGYLLDALKPFTPALSNANAFWRASIRANWINGVGKEDQKSAAKSLIRLGLSSANSETIAAAGAVDPKVLQEVLTSVENGTALTSADALVLGRLNAMIDAAMDAGFERADQLYRNASRVTAGLFSVGLSVWAGQLLALHKAVSLSPHDILWPSVLAGLIAVPIAPIAKDLASSLQAAASAVQAVKP